MLTRYELSIVFAAALLSGCGGLRQYDVAPPGAASTVAQTPAVDGHVSVSKSWMSPEATSEDLLYVSSESGGVLVLTYPGGKVVGSLGVGHAWGECVDKTQHVFVTLNDSTTDNVLEYAHGGTQPIAILSDTGYYPTGCAIDPTTGNLAVTSLGNSVAIFQGAQGNPTYFENSNVASTFGAGYDSVGDLFTDGTGTSRGVRFTLSELTNGSSTFINFKVPINVATHDPGGVVWYKRNLIVAAIPTDRRPPRHRREPVLRLKISGSTATLIGITNLMAPSPNSFRASQFWLQNGETLIQPMGYQRNIGFWKYPAGGDPQKVWRLDKGRSGIWHGVVLSLKG
jgi:hypothetical protein